MMAWNNKKAGISLSRTAVHEARAAYVFLIPAVVGLTVLTYGPLLTVFGLSFFNWRGTNMPSFIGFQNYVRLFTTDPFFKDALKVTAYFSFLTVFCSILYSLGVAMLLNRKIPARGFFRAVFYVPYILPGTAVYVGWSWLYESNFGFFNYLLSLMGISKLRFIADASLVIPSLALISVWLSGNLIVIFLAGLQNVPKVYYEAAEIDGANSFQRFRHVMIPSMTPIIFYNILMSLITNLQIITPALAITSGGPGNSSTFITYLMYRYAFRSSQLGYASAISFVFFIIAAIFTGILFATSKEWVFYEGDK
jgi:multiple sugar transport system permease protein